MNDNDIAELKAFQCFRNSHKRQCLDLRMRFRLIYFELDVSISNFMFSTLDLDGAFGARMFFRGKTTVHLLEIQYQIFAFV